MHPRLVLSIVMTSLVLLASAARADAAPSFSDWTDTTATSATGTFEGRAISLSGPVAPGSATDLSFSLFRLGYFDPTIEHADVLALQGHAGNSYTLTLGVPVRDPIIHLGSLASTITFAGSPTITKRSGEDTLTVSGSSVSGQLKDHQPDGTSDANGTIQLHGDFESLSFTAVPVYDTPDIADGFYFQLGGTLPPGPGNTARPQLGGRPLVPHALSCTTGSWNRPIAAYSYGWERAPRATTADDDPNWAPIAGATEASYDLQYADVGSRVRCRVFAADAKTLQGTAVSTSLRADTASPSPEGIPTISGPSLATGSPQTCDPGPWYSNPDFSYRWLRNGVPIPGAIDAVYRPVPDFTFEHGHDPAGDADEQISCEVTGSNDLGNSAPVQSRAIVPVDAPPLALTYPKVDIDLSPRNPIGRTAGCTSPQYWYDYNYGTPEYHHEYQWLRNGNPIAGATTGAYRTTVEDLGTELSCTVSANNPLGRSATVPSLPVLVPLPAGTQNAQVLRAGGHNRYDPVNLLALSDDYLKAVTEEILPSLRRAVDAETSRCAGRGDVPQNGPDFDDSQFPLNDVQRCQVLLYEKEYVEVTQQGVAYQGLRCRPCDLGFALPSVDPAKAPALDPVLAERLAPMTPDRVLWDLDGDGKTDATCPGSAPVLHTILNGGHWNPRAVIVAPDSAETQIYGMATTSFDHANAGDAAKFGAGKLRSGQPFTCLTSLAPPPNTDTGPCVTDGTIGRVHISGNLCPINVRNLDPDDIDALPDDLQPMLLAFSQAQERAATRTVYASLRSLRGVRSARAAVTLDRIITSTFVNTVASVSSLDRIYVSPTIKALRRVKGFDVQKVNFAADQIYLARDVVKINGVAVRPGAAGTPTVFVPSDVGQALDGVTKMTMSARDATRSLGGIALADRQDFLAEVSDATRTGAALLPSANLDRLAAAAKNVDLGPFRLRGTADVTLEDDGTATLRAKAVFPGLTDPVSGSDLRVDVTLRADLAGNIRLQGVHLHADSAFLGGVKLGDVDLTYDGGLSLTGEILFPPIDQGLKINRFRLNDDGSFQALDVAYLAGAGQGIPLGGGVYLTRLRGGLDFGPPNMITAGTSLSVGPSSGGGCPTIGADADFKVTFARHQFALDATADMQLICIPLATVAFHTDQTGYTSLGGHFGYTLGPIYARGDFGAQVRWPDWQVDFSGEVGVHIPVLGDVGEEGALVLSNYGIAGCAGISIPIIGTIRGGAGVRFPGGHFPGSLGELISNLHLFTGCDLSSYKSLPSLKIRAAGATTSSFELPAGSRGVALSFDGRDGAPLVRLRSPSGRLLDFASSPEGARLTQGLGVVLPDEHRTVVLLGKPEGGHWTVEPADGSPAIAGIRKADVLAPVSVHATVGGRGARRLLSYDARPQAGQVVRFVERAPGALQVVATVRGGGRGRVPFTVTEASGRRREIVAQVLQQGLPRQTLTLARFTAPNPRIGRVAGLRVRRAKSGAVVTWRRAPGAVSYAVGVTDSRGGRTSFAPRPGQRRVVVPGVGRDVTLRVTVIALSGRGRPGGPVRVSLRAATTRRAGRR